MTDESLLAARSKLALCKPYFASALWALKFVEIEDFANKYKLPGHIGIDKHWRIYYDPKVISSWSLPERMGVLVHEIGHVIRRHDRRAEMHGIDALNMLAWNLVGDLELNDDIKADKDVQLPKDSVLAGQMKMPDDLTAEEYYDMLPERKVNVVVNCGSGAHGVEQPWETKHGEGRGKVEKHEAEAIARATAEAIIESKSRGTVPAGWQRWADQYGSPHVDWRRELAAAIRRAAGDVRGMIDYSYRMPNRRQSAYGNIIMPAMVKPDPIVSIVTDTSGSMGEDDLQMALAEIKGILQAIGNKTAKFFSVDAEVHVAKRIQSARQVELKGGGGTDMPVGIAHALEDKPKPDVLIVITDGYTNWASEAPPCKLIACIVNEDSEGPSYAKTINIPPMKGVRK